MAVSAFKSSTRRATTSLTTTPPSSGRPNSDAGHRRSRSVSAFSRRPSDAEDFLNKRDNPLFWSNTSPPDRDEDVSRSSGGGGDRRGRSAARNGGNGGKESGRSVDPGRRNRSVSRCPVSRVNRSVNSESEAEQECFLAAKSRNGLKSDVECGGLNKKGLRSGSDIDSVERTKGLRTWSSQHSASEASHDSALALSRLNPTTNSLFKVEEKTVKAVSEQMKPSAQGDPFGGDGHGAGIYETVRSEVRRAISEIQNDLERAMGRSNASAIANANITDIPPDLVNPSAVELVLDIRREYAKKLEQSHERAKKLRADLAVEEHRGLELSRILKDVLPDPKTPSVQKSRPARKTSIERRKMSKRLTDEAMAYFDECVSLSTFDSSDFSSQEEPSINIVEVTSTPISNSLLSRQASSSASATHNSHIISKDKQDLRTQDQVAFVHDDHDLMASSSYKEPLLDRFSPTSIDATRDWKSAFSFARKPETPSLQLDIQKFIRSSEKDVKRSDTDSEFSRYSGYDLGDYKSHDSAQSFVFDRVVMKNEIECCSFLLCSGGVSVSFPPFASFF